MTTPTPSYMQPVDVHEALAHAHAERGVFLAQLFSGLVALPKRLVSAVRPHRGRVHHGARA